MNHPEMIHRRLYYYTPWCLEMICAKIRTRCKNRWADTGPGETVGSVGEQRVGPVSELEQSVTVVRRNPRLIR